MKEIKLYKPASYIVVLFVKSETNNFIKEIKHILRSFIVCENSRAAENPQLHLGFPLICSLVLPINVCLDFHQVMKERRRCFIAY